MDNLAIFPDIEAMEDFIVLEDIVLMRSEDDEEDPLEDEEEETDARKGYSEGETEKGQSAYNREFALPTSGVYFDEDKMSMEIEYDLLYEDLEPDIMRAGSDINPVDYAEQPKATHELLPAGYESAVMTMEFGWNEYPATAYANDVLDVEYDAPVLINGQKTYQRIVFEADADGESVYELTRRKLGDAGLEASSEYDGEFGSMIFTSINMKPEGAEGNFNEFYLNGEIGEDAVDRQKLSKGDVIEWRYAEETDGSCGGCPDFNSIKALLEYSAVAKAQASYLGIAGGAPGLPGMLQQNMMYS